jgi:hypothetical protein
MLALLARAELDAIEAIRQLGSEADEAARKGAA